MAKLNVPLIRILQERLLDNTRVEAFNMAYWVDTEARNSPPPHEPERIRAEACGTSACIAGHLAIISPEDWEGVPDGSILWDLIPDWAARKLGLTLQQAQALFSLDEGGETERLSGSMEHVTAAQAVQALENMITYGTPKWAEILKDWHNDDRAQHPSDPPAAGAPAG